MTATDVLYVTDALPCCVAVVVHHEVCFLPCFQCFQSDPHFSSQSVAWPHIGGEYLFNKVIIIRGWLRCFGVHPDSKKRSRSDPAFFLCSSAVVSLAGQRGHAQLLPESYPKSQVDRSFFYGACCGSFCLNESSDTCVHCRPTVSTTVRWPVLTPLKRKGNSLMWASTSGGSVNYFRKKPACKINYSASYWLSVQIWQFVWRKVFF